jgi:uncharacterized membrane protein
MINMKNFFLGLLLLLTLFIPGRAWAQAEDTGYAPDDFVRGKIVDITDEGIREEAGFSDAYQKTVVEVLGGADEGKTFDIEYVTSVPAFNRQKLHKGQTVVLQKNTGEGASYYILDSFRLPSVAVFVVLFFLAAAFFGRGKGISALLGLVVSLAILLFFVVPRIFAGDNPVLISAIGSTAIAVVSLLLAHGFNRRSFIALAATLGALFLAFVLAALAVTFTNLSGGGTEEAVFLQLGYLTQIDLRGLLLGGIVIGALGVLDDVTTAQVATIEEIHNANPSLDFKELYKRGISVGREHIAALVNTLALAYVGASFPIFLLFTMPGVPPLWVTLNGENIVEEIVRALVGGLSLMLAVPISTVLAALFFEKAPLRPDRKIGHTHTH